MRSPASKNPSATSLLHGPQPHYDTFDVVVLPFPYADRLAEKRRPGLVISNQKLAPFGVI